MGNYRLYELVIGVLDRPLEGDDGKLGMGLAVTTLPRSSSSSVASATTSASIVNVANYSFRSLPFQSMPIIGRGSNSFCWLL
jgi:hypothetical protein